MRGRRELREEKREQGLGEGDEERKEKNNEPCACALGGVIEPSIDSWKKQPKDYL